MDDANGITKKVDSIFTKLVSPDRAEPGKSVGILVGVTYHEKGHMKRDYFKYGKTPLHEEGEGTRKDSVLFIGSNTKVFTATLLAYCQISGIGINIDTGVQELLPSNTSINFYDDDPILLWHLATHSAGFPDGPCGSHKYGNYPFSAMQEFLTKFQPAYPPGTKWVYSNQGFALLGVLLSHALSGQSSTEWDSTYEQWPNNVMEYVVRPLKMEKTQVDYQQIRKKVAQGFTLHHNGQNYDYGKTNPPDWNLLSAGLGAGALSSTLEDMLLFLEAQISPPNSDLGKAIALTQTHRGDLSMGLGWQIGNNYFDKNGAIGGYESYMAFDPTAKIGIMVLGNTAGDSALDKGGRDLLGLLRDDPASPSKFPHPDAIPQCP